jgi:thioredoxin 1
MAFEFTDQNFQDEAIEKGGVTVIDFWAEWCGPCRMVAPIIDQLADEYQDKVKIGKVDVDSNVQVSMKYGIRSIPTILILRDGEVVEKHVGTISKKALTDKIESAMAPA